MRISRVHKSLIKLLAAAVVLATLVALCFVESIGDLRGLIVFFMVVLGFPITLLLGVDASRTIKREIPSHRSLSILGRLLAFPQAVLGTILLGFSLVYPVFEVPAVIHDLSGGRVPVLGLSGLAMAAVGFAVGMHYIREGLGLEKPPS
jgi:hypothetical protein